VAYEEILRDPNFGSPEYRAMLTGSGGGGTFPDYFKGLDLSRNKDELRRAGILSSHTRRGAVKNGIEEEHRILLCDGYAVDVGYQDGRTSYALVHCVDRGAVATLALLWVRGDSVTTSFYGSEDPAELLLERLFLALLGEHNPAAGLIDFVEGHRPSERKSS
jgi:hypothetical protein